jgi:hypothetical protein
LRRTTAEPKPSGFPTFSHFNESTSASSTLNINLSDFPVDCCCQPLSTIRSSVLRHQETLAWYPVGFEYFCFEMSEYNDWRRGVGGLANSGIEEDSWVDRRDMEELNKRGYQFWNMTLCGDLQCGHSSSINWADLALKRIDGKLEFLPNVEPSHFLDQALSVE